MAFLLPSATFISRKLDGTPNALGKVWTYAAGTLTPQDSFTTASLTVEHENPVPLDPDGTARIWLDPALSYRIREYTADDELIRDTDYISAGGGGGDGSVLGRYIWEIEEQTSTEGQTVIELNAITLVPGTNAQQVIIDGLTLPPSAYTVGEDGDEVTLADPLPAGREIAIIGGRFINAVLDASEVSYTAPGGVPRTQDSKNAEILSAADYGATGNGAADDTAELQAALDAAAGGVLILTDDYLITAALVASSNTDIHLAPGSILRTATADISHIDASGKARVRVFGPGKILKTGTGAAAYVAGVKMDGSSHCLVDGVEFEGMQWTAAYLKTAINCKVVRCYVHDHLGTVQDACGVAVHGASRGCEVTGNRFVATGWHSVLVQDSDATAGVVPIGTKVLNNDCSGATAYGIACYELTAEDSDTLISGNRVTDVTGVNPGGSGGAGIYVQGSGGVRVVGNAIRNVCTLTSVANLTPAGIGVANITTALAPPVVEGNTIGGVGVSSADVQNSNSLPLAGISVAASAGGAVVSGNSITQAALTTPTFSGVYVNAASRTVVQGNKIVLPVTGSASVGIFGFANGSAIAGLSLSGNDISGGTSAYILVTETGGFTTSGLSVVGGSYRGGSSACRGVQLNAVVGYSLSGLQVDAGDDALFVNASTGGRITGSRFETAGATGVLTTGTCTGSFMDASNYWGATDSKVDNGATGFSIEWRGGTAAPAAGTWAVSDRTIRSAPVVGQPKAWACTVAGTPGTWVSEGDL